MKNIKITFFLFGGLLLLSCKKSNKPNYQFFPNMYKPVGYETYQHASAFPNGMEAMLPPEGTVSRGWKPYRYANTAEGYQEAKKNLINPLEISEENLKVGKDMYGIYCAVCHGDKGDGQGILMQREKFLGIPSYATRELTSGSIYHVIYYGINSMGSYAAQLNEQERWKVVMYVERLKENLSK